MTTCSANLEIDFGLVGYHTGKEPFRVSLDSSRLKLLVEHAAQAHRVYELMLVERPGDVWEYVTVTLIAAPNRVVRRLQYARATEPSGPGEATELPISLPFLDFDKLFYLIGDDTDPEDEAWINHRDTTTMRSYANQLIAGVRAAQTAAEGRDRLARHAVERIRSGTHPFAYLDRVSAVGPEAGQNPAPTQHTAAFHAQLEKLLRDGEVVSVAYRGDGDYQVLRAMANEQRRRADLTHHLPSAALHLSALVDRQASNAAWGSEIWFFSEGIGLGDLFIQGIGMGSGSAGFMTARTYTTPGRYILSASDEGLIDGFSQTTGDGWVLYRKDELQPRRVGLERLQIFRSSKFGAVLTFKEGEATLFDYDKAVVFVGEDVPAGARKALALSIADWEQHGGDPVCVVLGDPSPFEQAGCRRLHLPKALDSDEAESWLHSLLRQTRPWIDVVIAVSPPTWASAELARVIKRSEGPWKPWVVTSGEVGALKSDFAIDGDLGSILAAAHEGAKRSRSKWI